MPSFLSLPLELIHEVISIAALLQSYEEDDGDTRLFSQCGLVCKTFYRVTRELQFNVLELTLNAKDARVVPEILTYQHKDLSLPSLIRLVRELNLTFDLTQHVFNESYVDHLDAFLSPFSGDACRLREFAFLAEKDKDEARIVYPDALVWHDIPSPTQQKFASILQLPSLEVLDIYGIINLPFRLLQSTTSSLTSLILTLTSVAVDLEDICPSPAQVAPLLLAIEVLNIGDIEFKSVPPPNVVTRKTDDNDNPSIALDTGLSRLIDFTRLQSLIVVQAPPNVHFSGSTPPLKEIFALCSDLKGLEIQFARGEDLHTFHLDKLPPSVTWLELHSFVGLPFVSGLPGAPDTQAQFAGPNKAALFPTHIASSSSPHPQLSDVTIHQLLSLDQGVSSAIETLVLADGRSYWDALVQNLMMIPASTIYLEIEVSFKTITRLSSSTISDDERPGEKLEAEMNRIFEEYNTNHPNKPIIVHYNCSLTVD